MNIVLNLDEPILYLKYLANETIACIDKNSTVRILSIKDLKIIDGFKTKLEHKYSISNIVDVSCTGKYSIIGMPSKGKAALFVNASKKLIATIGIHNGEIETVAISDNETYLATGGTDGRTFIYHVATASILTTLPHQNDYISAIKFSDNSNIIAIGSFNRTILIKNIALMSDSFNLKGHLAPIRKIVFISSQLLVSTDRDGYIIVWNLQTKKIKIRLEKMYEEISDIILYKNKHFLFVSTTLGNIGLYNLKTFKCITHRFLKIQGAVNALTIIPKQDLLVYATNNGKIGTHPLLKGEDDLADDIKRRDYKSAYARIEENILLSFSIHYQNLELLWKTTINKVKDYLGKGKKESATAIIAPFDDVFVKRSSINMIFKEFAEFERFKIYINEYKYALAYALSFKHPMYKETPEYNELEAIWERQFLKAKKAVLAKATDLKVKEHLAMFKGISNKARLITALCKHRKIYIFFNAQIIQKDFLVLFQLVEKYPFLTELKELKELQNWANKIYIKAYKAYGEENYIDTIKYACMIENFPKFKTEIVSLVKNSKAYIAFKQAISSNSLDKVYELVQEHDFLSDAPVLKTLDDKWENILVTVNKPMLHGNIDEVLEILKSYSYIKYKKNHVILFIKTTYLNQLKYAIKNDKQQTKIILNIKKIYSIFGEDELLMIIVRDYEQKHNININFSYIRPSDLREFDLQEIKSLYY